MLFASAGLLACSGPPGAGPDAGPAGADAPPAVVDGSAPDGATVADPGSRFGIGLVGPGSQLDWDLAADLDGPGGHVRVILAGITRDTTGPDPSWVDAIDAVYDRGQIPVVRLAAPWGSADQRDASDDAAHLDYHSLAAAYARVVEGLPRRAGLPLWIEVLNEPNLCYEWKCTAGSGDGGGDQLGYATTAHEYAALLRDTADALHAIGDPRIKVINAGLAPGGAASCQCGGDGYTAGVTSRDFLTEMKAQVPDVFDRLDGFASHACPAQGEGWGFFVPYDQAGPGLHWYARELEIVGRDLPVLITETGWTTDGGGSREQIAGWTVQAYQDVWLTDPRIVAVMPFMLRDAAWDAFGWAAPGGGHYPVYDAVRALRCSMIDGRCP